MISTESLLAEMTDLLRLAEYPQPEYRCWQASSYDRRSVAPDQPGWFANGDAGQFLAARPGDNETEYVLLDTVGPGCIVRVWSANPTGVLRVYIDDFSRPAWQGDFRDLLTGQGPVPEPLAAVCARGCNLYFPFPFAERCRVSVVGNPDSLRSLYYHVNCRSYPPGTGMESFQEHDFERLAPAIAALQQRLLAGPPPPLRSDRPIRFDASVASGERLLACHLPGPQAVTEFRLRLQAADLERCLQHVLLQVRFDDSPAPQIDAPVGAFFGAGPGLAIYESWPFSVGADGWLVCRLPMPFARNATLFLWNRGSHDVKAEGHVYASPYSFGPSSMHLRAKWRVDHDVCAASTREPAWPASLMPMYDWPFIIVHGRGVYVGTSLAIMNPTPVTTLSGGWWGEGDEKVYLDGESFPSTFGTGSEDYFGYAWSCPDRFAHAYIAQPRCDGPGNRGITVNNRWHVIDPLPFRQSLEFYMELGHHAPTPGVSYGRISYVYASPGARDDHVQISDSNLHFPPPPEWQVSVHPRDAERHAALEVETAPTSPAGQVVEDRCYSGGAAKTFMLHPGEEAGIALAIKRAGHYWLALGCGAGPNAGTVQLALMPAGRQEAPLVSSSVTLYSPVACMREVSLHEGLLALEAGTYELRCTMESTPKEGDAAALTVDYVRWLEGRR